MHCLLTSVDDHITNVIALCGADVEETDLWPALLTTICSRKDAPSSQLQLLFARFFSCVHFSMDFPGGAVVKNPPANVGEEGWIPGWGRFPGGGNGNPLQYSCLENSVDREACRGTVPGVTKSQTCLSTYAVLFNLIIYSKSLFKMGLPISAPCIRCNLSDMVT